MEKIDLWDGQRKSMFRGWTVLDSNGNLMMFCNQIPILSRSKASLLREGWSKGRIVRVELFCYAKARRD